MSPTLRTTAVDAPSDLEALEPAWWDLFHRADTATPFQCPAWQRPWWAVFAPGDLAGVAVWSGDRLAGLAVLYREEGVYGRRLLPVGIGLSDYADILVDPAVAGVAGAITTAIGAHEGWDVLSLEDLAEGAAALRLAVPPSWTEEIRPSQVSPVLDLAPGLAAVPADRRRKVRRAIRLSEARGGLAVERIVDPAAVPGAMAHLVRLHESRWQSRGEAGLTADDRVRRFHEAAGPDLVARGLARLYLLRIGGAVAAAWYGLAHRETTYAYMGGFDPAFAYESPGAILMTHAIEEAVAEGRRRFDFLRGAEPYKYGFGAKDTRSVSRILRRGP